MANSKLELNDSKEVTWSAAVSLDDNAEDSHFRRLDMRSMSGRGGRSSLWTCCENNLFRLIAI